MTSNSNGKPDLERVLAGLKTLLSPREVTEAFLHETIKGYPELMTEAVEDVGRLLAGYQQTTDGRESVPRLVGLLRRCRELGVTAAISEHKERLAAEGREDRLRVERARRREERRRRAPSRLELASAPWATGEVFGSLAECRAWIEHEYPQDTVKVLAELPDRPDGKNLIETSAPRYMYRGESGVFSATMSSLDRLLAASNMSADAVEDLMRIAIKLRYDLERQGLSILLADGFLQHYGMPTPYLDVTRSLDVAVSFASDLGIGEIGALCVMETSALIQSMQLVDLRNLPNGAQRPHRQAAFAITDPRRIHRNLKDSQAIVDCGVRWFRFVLTEPDADRFEPDPWLLDAHSDRVAGLIQLLLDSYGKMHDECARWISEHIQPAPFMLVTSLAKESGEGVRWVSADEAGVPYIERDSRKSNYERWSNKFDPVVPKPLPPELLSNMNDVLAAPGAVLQVLRRPGLEAFGLAPDEATRPKPALDEQGELHDALYRAATDLLMPYFEPTGGHRPSTTTEVETVRRACLLLQRVVAIHSANWNAQWVLGMAYRSIGDYEASYVALHEAYALEQQNPDVGRELSIACMMVGRDDEAVRVANEVLIRNTRDDGLMANLALALFLARQVDKATEVVVQAWRMNPKNDITGRLGAIISNVSVGRYDDAETMARWLVELSPSDPVTARVLTAVRQARDAASAKQT